MKPTQVPGWSFLMYHWTRTRLQGLQHVYSRIGTSSLLQPGCFVCLCSTSCGNWVHRLKMKQCTTQPVCGLLQAVQQVLWGNKNKCNCSNSLAFPWALSYIDFYHFSCTAAEAPQAISMFVPYQNSKLQWNEHHNLTVTVRAGRIHDTQHPSLDKKGHQ